MSFIEIIMPVFNNPNKESILKWLFWRAEIRLVVI